MMINEKSCSKKKKIKVYSNILFNTNFFVYIKYFFNIFYLYIILYIINYIF